MPRPATPYVQSRLLSPWTAKLPNQGWMDLWPRFTGATAENTGDDIEKQLAYFARRSLRKY